MATIHYVINTDFSGNELTEDTRDESLNFCTEFPGPIPGECPNSKSKINTYIPQAGDSLMIMQRDQGSGFNVFEEFSTIANVNGDGTGGLSTDFDETFYRAFFFMAKSPSFNGIKFGILNIADIAGPALFRGDKILVTGPHATEGTDVYTVSADGFDGWSFKKFTGETS